MDAVLAEPTIRRQVLVNLGDRYVVFGPPASLPEHVAFDREKDADMLPPLPPDDDTGATAARIVQTVRVAGTRAFRPPAADYGADLELATDDGRCVGIDIRVRHDDLRLRDQERSFDLLQRFASDGKSLEVWHINVDRPKLTIMYLDRGALGVAELVPLDVWEKTPEGVHDRAMVVAEVKDWAARIDQLYGTVRGWLSDRGDLAFDQSRTTVMSEDLMQKFAVPDRELPILDILRSEEAIATFVPRGLWLIGSWGRVDVITTSRTYVLHAIRRGNGFEWRMFPLAGSRATAVPFDRNALSGILAAQ